MNCTNKPSEENIEVKFKCNKSSQNMIKNQCHVSSLPVEVIIYLMEFLTYSDRVAASQVCQLWYEASLHPKFINQEKVVIKKSATQVVSVLKNTSRPYFHFVLLGIEINSKMADFWMQIASDLKSLYFGNCDMYDKVLINLLSSCYNLESLALENCRELFMSGRLLDTPEDVETLFKSLSKLRQLNLCFNRYLSDAIFNRLMAAMPNLDTISLEGCQISYHSGLLMRYYPDRLTADNTDYSSETVLTFMNFFKTLKNRARIIKSINLSHTLVDSISLSSISETNKLGLELKELYVAGCEQLTNAGIVSLALHQSALTVLDMSSCSRITDQALLSICGKLTHLVKLSVRNCRAITDLGAVQLKELVNLEELDISQCEQVTGKGIQEGLCGKLNKKLRKLFVEGLNTITSGTIILLAENLPALTHLNLSFCFNAVTDVSIQAIFQHLPWLRSLKLANCDALTDAGLTGMRAYRVINVQDQTSEEEIKQEGSQGRLHISLRSKAEEEIVKDALRKKVVQKMCESQLLETSNVGYSLDRLKGLQELDLRSCNKITDVSLKYAFSFLELQHLNLSQCQQITHVGLRAVGEKNPSIDTLSLGHCYNVTDEGVEALTFSLQRLKYLDIKGCNQLTAASIVAIAQNCHQLCYLDASQNNNISDKIIELLPRLPAQTFYSRSDQFTAPMAPPPPPPLHR